MAYEAPSRMNRNGLISDPTLPDPDNLPEPLGWCLLVRPYPVGRAKHSSIELPDEVIDGMSYVTNIARVVSVGPCCWSRPEHRDSDGNQFQWVKPGDFISYPRNVGSRRTFKGVTYILLVDDEVVERLPDPLAFDDGYFKINIPKEDLEKYNTIYNENQQPRPVKKVLEFKGD